MVFHNDNLTRDWIKRFASSHGGNVLCSIVVHPFNSQQFVSINTLPIDKTKRSGNSCGLHEHYVLYSAWYLSDNRPADLAGIRDRCSCPLGTSLTSHCR